MSAPAPPRPTGPPPAPPPAPQVTRPSRPPPWFTAAGAAVSVLLAGAPVSAIVQGTEWLGHAALAVAVVAAVGLLLYRTPAAVVVVGQCIAVLVLVAVRFTGQGIFSLLPEGGALADFGTLLAGAGEQIDSSTAPVASTPEILFLVTAAFGLLAVAVYLAAVIVEAPAAAGVPLLAVFAVPAALADDLLPWWAAASAAAGFGLLLIARDGARRQVTGGTVVVAGAAAIALAIGSAAGMIGTAGRFDAGSAAGGSGSSIGLSPFTALRGQLNLSTPTELLRVRGLPRSTYLRALTLRDYVPEAGWQATQPDPGIALPGQIDARGGEIADVEVSNVGFKDYWLPVFGAPLAVTDLTADRWVYDTRSGTGYTSRPREEASWRQRALLDLPTVPQLRDAEGSQSPGTDYLGVQGVDGRVIAIAQQVAQGQSTAFDKAMALQDFFTGPQSPFRYSLQTAPGGGDDALVEFLTVGRTGYCEQYASAMGVMLRGVGIPARVAVGFTGGKETSDYRSISTSDAHAWVEAWFPGIGWTTFDPTPLTDGRTIIPPYVQEARAQSAGSDGSATDDDPFNAESGTPTPEQAAPQESTPEAQAAEAPQGVGLPLWPPAVVVVIAIIVAAPAVLRRREGRTRLGAALAGGPSAAGAAWKELLADSTDRGTPAKASDTVRATARMLVHEHRLDGAAQQALRQVVSAVEASWYGGTHPQPGELDTPVRAVKEGIAAGSSLTVRERLVPRSLLRKRKTAVDTSDDDRGDNDRG